MRLRALPLALVAALALAASSAAAEPPRVAFQLYAAGDYLGAADTADDVASPDDLAFAARAVLAAYITADDDADIASFLDRAEHLAREALALDPSSVEARLQLALVYGLRAQRMPLTDAFRRNFAPRGRRLIEEALRGAPNDARAHALLGAWHFEVLRRGGPAGGFIYGARFDRGAAAFARAMDLSPHDVMIPLHFAVALLELDGRANAPRALALLRAASALPPRDALEVFAANRAAHLAQVLADQGPESASRAARALRL